jgi:hypothetical protein
VRGGRPKTLIVLLAVIVACAVFAPLLMTPSHLEPKAERRPSPVDVDRISLWSDEEEDRPADDPDAVDLYGNEVTDAVAKYRLDASGSLYELHSPQTEVPRLAPPKT